MARATPILSSSIHPTMGDLHLIFPTILNILYDAINSEIQIKSQIANESTKTLMIIGPFSKIVATYLL